MQRSKKELRTYTICSLNDSKPRCEQIMVERFSEYLQAHADLEFPHRHNFYHLVYFLKGKGSHSVDFVRFPVTVGQIYFMAPDQVHSWDFEDLPDGYIINFSAAYLKIFLADASYLDQFSFFSCVPAVQVISIPSDARLEVEQIFEKMLSQLKGGVPEHKHDFVRTLMIQLFIEVNKYAVRTPKQKPNNNNVLLLKKFIKLIENNYKQLHLTREYAALLFVTPNKLNASVKEVTGRSAGELIRDRLILEAKRLLINSDLNISEIAYRLHFADASYFSKFFKKSTGQTPEIFRKKLPVLGWEFSPAV